MCFFNKIFKQLNDINKYHKKNPFFKMVIEKKILFLFLAPSSDKIFSTLFTLYETQNSP